MNLGDLKANAKQLGNDLLDQLTSGLLSHVTDPQQVALVSKATAKIAAAGIALVGGVTNAQATEDINAGMAVLWSLASADSEDAAATVAAAQAKLGTFVQSFLEEALTTAIKAIPVLAVAA